MSRRTHHLAAVIAAGGSLLLVGCGTVGRAEEGNLSSGKQLFTENCGSCHVLEDAGTQGKIGPNLDDAFAVVRDEDQHQGFDESTIRDVVRGQIAYAVENPATDAPGMPRDLVKGRDADAVASYVAAVAGVPENVRPQVGGGAPTAGGGAGAGAGGGGSAGGGTDGKAVFASAGCGSCHALAAAEAKGAVGPNLDESQPSVELAIDRVTNGKGGMPAFKDQLSKQQIQAVATFVSENAAE